MRTWVGAFSRNIKGPYLDYTVLRNLLFPMARLTSVVGYVGPDFSKEDDLLQSPEEERKGKE